MTPDKLKTLEQLKESTNKNDRARAQEILENLRGREDREDIIPQEANQETTQESFDAQQERYREIELSPTQRQQSQPQYTQQPQQPDPQIQTQDPVAQVKNMISAGYTPSQNLVQNTAQLLKLNKSEYSDVWFAILLQKLVSRKNK